MSSSFSWRPGSGLTDLHWARFCSVAKVALDCPALPLYSDVPGGFRPVRLAVTEVQLRGRSTSSPSIELYGAQGEAEFSFSRSTAGVALCTESVAGLAYAALLTAKATLPRFSLNAAITPGHAGIGMLLARQALVGRAFSPYLVDKCFEDMPGFDALPEMAPRALACEALKLRVQQMLCDVLDAMPSGPFEEVTLRTAKAVLWRIENGIDPVVDALRSVQSLEASFGRSSFIKRSGEGPQIGDPWPAT